MAEGFYQLTYRDLAERLGISPDAARMKANRKAKAGRWRLLPDDAPGQERRVEIPVEDLDDVPARAATVQPPATPERIEPAQPADTAERVQIAEPVEPAERAVLVEPAQVAERLPAVEPVEPAERIQPIGQPAAAEPIEPVAPAPIAEPVAAAERPAAAERIEPGERIEPVEPVAEPAGADLEDPRTDELEDDIQTGDSLVTTLAARVATLTDRLLEETNGRARDRDDLAASEVRERELKVEIERLCVRVSDLTAALDKARRPWWRGLIQGSDD